MNQIAIDGPHHLELPSPTPSHEHCTLIFKVVTVAAHFFQAIWLGLVKAAAWLKDRVIDLVPERTAMWLDPRRLFIRTVLGIAPEERAAVLQQTLPHIAPQMDQPTRDRLIQVVADNGPISRLSRNMLQFITSSMYSSESLETTVAIANIPAEQRDAIMTYTNRLATAELPKRMVIETITGIPSQERDEEVIRNILRLLHPQMTPFLRTLVIVSVRQFPVNRRLAVLTASLAYITPNMGFDEKLDVIMWMGSLPEESRGAIIAAANVLITADMGYQTKHTIIRAVAPLPTLDRGDVIHHARQLIDPQMTDFEIPLVIRDLARIPAGQRADFVARYRRTRLVRPTHMGNR